MGVVVDSPTEVSVRFTSFHFLFLRVRLSSSSLSASCCLIVRYPQIMHVLFPSINSGVDLFTNPMLACVSVKFLPALVVTFTDILIHRSIHTTEEPFPFEVHARSTGTPLGEYPSSVGDITVAFLMTPESMPSINSSYCESSTKSYSPPRSKYTGLFIIASVASPCAYLHT